MLMPPDMGRIDSDEILAEIDIKTADCALVFVCV